ncbi:MAG: bifunctional oligoribonuclease/PAP phosphatase NrnA [Bdellovibrionaceae bacterium]|jgi:bifunctional oligoribonuclease and PAP phosphatase NrnA|nr:bifunctional oligoribonuclease/PAP phosphatase NrnA [Pseudobdellovibrionaceae bacterium]
MMLNNYDLSPIIKKIQAADSIILSTHKQCDGDGLGAALGLYHALKKINKKVRVMLVDEPADKYHFFFKKKDLDIFESPHEPIEQTDLTLIFDTNDRRLIEPLYSQLEEKCSEILFVDHHPVLKEGPLPPDGSFIDVRAASTGELSYFIIKGLDIELDKKIARCLYASIAFDTQIFKYVKNLPNSMLIAADLLKHEAAPEDIHQNLFASYSKNKLHFLGAVLGSVEYFNNDQISILIIPKSVADKFQLSGDDTRDVIDMLMNVKTVEVAAFLRETDKNSYKLSLRSKGRLPILNIAESFGGGGHLYAAGASIQGNVTEIKSDIVKVFNSHIEDDIKSNS